MGAGRLLPLPVRHAKATAVALLLTLAVALALGATSLSGILGNRAALPAAAHTQRLADQSLLSLPLQARGPISASLGAGNASYRVSSSAGALQASSPADRLSSSFARAGVSVSAGAARLSLSLRGIRDGRALHELATTTPRAHANRVTYAHGDGVSEWYANGPLGLEQGFTVAKAPSAAQFSISLALGGNTLARLAADAQSVAFIRDGKSALRYSGLSVTDASGRRLPSSLALSGHELSIRVRSAGAHFPVTVDPFVQDGAKLSPTGASGSASDFGWSVALSADGDTALVGSPADNSRKGAVWAFVRSGSTWTQQGTKLTPLPGNREEGQGIFGESRFGEFGSSVALSANGNTALIGAEGDLEEEGAVWFFVRSGSAWSQQGGPELPFLGSGGNEETPYESAESRFGSSVSLSADGNVALVGAPGGYEGEGLGFVYTRSGSKWSELANLEASDESGSAGSELGTSVALSGDGTTALLGGPNDARAAGQDPGAAWVFTDSSGPWTQQGPKLTGSEESGTIAEFGDAVALSADGNTALIGAPGEGSRTGAAFAFVRSGTSWSQQGPKLLATGESGAGELGSSAALSSDGDTALLGSPGDNSKTGSAWLFARSEATWTQVEQLTSTGVGPGAQLGHALALAGDAATALIGDREGGVRIFVAGELPGVLSEAATAIAQTSATLNGTVNPNGEAISECVFEYGTTSAYGSTAPCSSPPGEGSSPVAVSAPVTPLTPGTTYHFRLLATNAAGTNVGEDRTFFSVPEAPSVTTSSASSVTTSSATLNGTVDPNRGTVGECVFEYGTSTSYGETVPCSPSPGSGDSPVAVSGSIAGLSANATYYYRLHASNAGGTGYGAGQSFAALNGAPEFGFCVKVAPGTGPYANSSCTKLGGKGIYAWQTSGVTGTTFVTHVSSSALIKLTAANKYLTVDCRGETGSGEFSGPKTVGAVTLTLSECYSASGHCTSSGDPSGTIVANPLEGVLGVEKAGASPAKDKIGLDLFPPGHTGAVAQFTCGTSPQQTIRGSVIVALKSNKMLSTQALKFKAAGTKQKPEGFAGSGQDVLEEQLGTGPFTQVGLALKSTLTSSREVEVSSIL